MARLEAEFELKLDKAESNLAKIISNIENSIMGVKTDTLGNNISKSLEKANLQVGLLKNKLETLGNSKLELKDNINIAKDKIGILQQKINLLEAKPTSLKVSADILNAQNQITKLENSITKSGTKSKKIDLDISSTQSTLGRLENDIKNGINSGAKGGSLGIKREFTDLGISQLLKSQIVAGLAAQGIQSAVSGISSALKDGFTKGLNVESQFTSLKTIFKGVETDAKKASQEINKFATETPYSVSQVTDAYIKLKNYGLDSSEKSLRSFGNTASALGKPLNQMVEAVADAGTGQFERLKEFGIKSEAQGDKVKFTFDGITTTVGKNSKEITNYLTTIGETKFAGGMEAQSKTLGGTLSTLGDSFDTVLYKILGVENGVVVEGGVFDKLRNGANLLLKTLSDPNFLSSVDSVAKGIIDGFSSTSEFISKINFNVLGQQIQIITPIVAGFVAGFTAFSIITTVVRLFTALTAAGGLLTVATALLGTALAFLTAPITLIAIGFGLLVAASTYLYQNWTQLSTQFPILHLGLNTLGSIFNTVLLPAFNLLSSVVMTQLLPALTGLWNTIAPVLIPVLQVLGGILAGIVAGSIALLVGALIGLTFGFTFVLSKIVEFTIFGINLLTSFFALVIIGFQNMANIIKNVLSVLSFTIQSVFLGYYTIISGVMQSISIFISAVWQTIVAIFTGNTSSIGSIWSNFGNNLKSIWQGVGAQLLSIGQNLLSGLSSIFSNLVSQGFAKFNQLKEGATSAINSMVESAKTTLSKLPQAFTNAANDAKDNLLGILRNIKLPELKFPEIKLPPIPSFATGVTNFGGGMAEFGEKGREMLRFPNGAMALAGSRMFGALPKGTDIFNNSETEKMLKPNFSQIPVYSTGANSYKAPQNLQNKNTTNTTNNNSVAKTVNNFANNLPLPTFSLANS